MAVKYACAVFVLTLNIFCGNAEYMTKKFCDNVDSSQCAIHNVQLDPCPHGPNFCVLKRSKSYSLTMDFTPSFRANSLSLSMYADTGNAGTFDRPVKTPNEACGLISCPVEPDVRRIFDVDFSLDKTFPVAKFPMEVKLWNDDDKTQACCFTINVKLDK